MEMELSRVRTISRTTVLLTEKEGPPDNKRTWLTTVSLFHQCTLLADRPFNSCYGVRIPSMPMRPVGHSSILLSLTGKYLVNESLDFCPFLCGGGPLKPISIAFLIQPSACVYYGLRPRFRHEIRTCHIDGQPQSLLLFPLIDATELVKIGDEEVGPDYRNRRSILQLDKHRNALHGFLCIFGKPYGRIPLI